MTKLLQRKQVKLKCPHCMQEITDTWICEMDSVIGLRYAYICTNCEKLLSISSSKDSPLFITLGNGGVNNHLKNEI
ncbi:MAG: hypothetical protein KJN64_07175 [Ignavibacteria bacterium]|nr:hypothetical protein [Ignavibacteria bacterium]MBT8381040.1 hypothetical protein [Ignavibacteria bacterium]MBT8393043.1 hypothetical protein [Ignavibacteria bacterium]NNJ52010.1 hypothetical protein [Ignavibacteriaceae bacterium]NNL19727.1 hypothetical protein [Ignavibacteriaceae bacterium]